MKRKKKREPSNFVVVHVLPDTVQCTHLATPGKEMNYLKEDNIFFLYIYFFN